MSPLRQRMIQDMQLRGFSAGTQECCAAPVGQLASHLANRQKVARPTATIALCEIDSCPAYIGAVWPCSAPQHLSQALPPRPPVLRGRPSICANVGEPAKPRSLYYTKARKAR